MDIQWLPSSLSRRKNTYYVTQTLPKELRFNNAAKQDRISTQTSDLKIAKLRKAELEHALRMKILAKAARQHLTTANSAFQRAVIYFRLTDLESWVSGLDGFGEPVVATFMDPPTEPDHFIQCLRVLHRKKAELEQAIQFQSFGSWLTSECNPLSPKDMTADEAHKIINAAIAEIEDFSEALIDNHFLTKPTKTGPFAVENTKQTKMRLRDLKQLVQAELNNRISAGSIRHKTAISALNDITLFLQVYGHVPVDEFTKREANKFISTLEQRYSSSSIQTKKSNISRLFLAAIHQGLIDSDPFSAVFQRRGGRTSKNWDPLPDALLEDLFSDNEAPHYIKTIWAILISTGMRIDEVATLESHQIQTDSSGVDFIDLTNAVVKRNESRRKVPIPEMINPLVKFYTSRPNQPGRSIFGLKKNRDGKTKISNYASPHLQRIAERHSKEFPGRKWGNHSMRGTLKDKLRDKDYKIDLINQILGHGGSSVSDTYGAGYSLQKMSAALNSLPHPYMQKFCSLDP